MASLTSPSLPNSFQLRLGFQCRKSSLVFMRTRVRTVKRRICSFAASESAGKGRDGSERSLSGDSWTNSGSSSDSFSGWFGADSGGSQRKRGFGGIVGVGVAGVILAAGLTIATLSLSKRSASGTKQEMEPLTVQQEVLLASDNQNDLVEEVRNEDNIVMPDEGNLSESSPESKTGTDKESFSSPEFTEFNSESRPDDDINVRTSLIENVESASNNIDAIKNASSQEDMQFRSGFDGHTVPSNSNPSSPRMAEYVIVEGSSDASSFKESEGNPAIAPPGLVTELKENRIAVNPIDSSVSDADLANLNAYYHEEISVSREIEDSKLLLDSSGSGHQIPSETALNSSVSIELDVILDPHVESKDKMETVTSPLNTDFDLSKMLQVPNEGITSHLEGNNLDETGSSGATSLSVLANPYANDPNTNGYSEMDRSKSLFEPPIPEGSFSSAGIPAPSLVSVALQVPPGKVLVPAAVDQVQGQALAALQVLKVIEADVQPGDLCTRREYARWLVFASNALSRNTVSKVYPAMYIENVTDLAFDDITPEDRDFASIQGLAEAGLISSKLSRRDMLSSPDEEQKIFLFSPNSPLSRQDLVSWKMALDKRQLPEVDSKILYQRSGFIDIDKINPDAFPALVADLSAGEQGIVALAFGYTRLFQPDKPVTKAQAAIAIATGEAADIVSEELTRIEAESMAEAAVAAHSALVAQVEKDVNASFEKELAMEREKIDAVEKLAEEARLELERLRAEREEENNALLRGKAAVESEMEVLSRLRREVEEQLQSLMSNKMEISFERERINKLRKEAESENQAIARLQYELEVERKALSMARAWAEDEAKRAREHAKALEEARERWERHGIKVIVDDDLRDDASAEVTWLEAGKQSAVSGTVSRAENLVENLKAMASKIRGDSKAVVEKIIQKIISLISTLREWATEAARQAGELQGAAVLKVSESVQELHQNTAEFSFAVKEGAKRIAGDCKEGVEKFTQKFKT